MLQISELKFAYRKTPVLRGIDLQVGTGELVALLGANGSGKSTLMKCLCGVLRPSCGAIKLDGTDQLQVSMRQRARRLGYVPQSLNADETALTVHETIAQGVRRPGLRLNRTEQRLRTIAAMQEVGLTSYAFTPVNRLSGGERQRVFIGRALARNTDYLLLDEPVSALDLKYQTHIMAMLRDLAHAGRGVLAIVHDLNLAACFADRVALLAGGVVCAAGAPATVLRADLLREVYDTDVEVTMVAGRPVVLPCPPAAGS